MPKYLCLQRNLPGGEPHGEKPSPAQMQAMYAKFNAWREKFQKNLVDLGGRLGAGRLVDRAARAGRPVRRGQGAGRRLHDRLRSEPRRGDRGRARVPGARPPRLGRRGHRDPRAGMTSPLGRPLLPARVRPARGDALAPRRRASPRAVEDAVQRALLAAVESWPKGSVPENPSAWLFRVAHNHVVGELRQRARRDADSQSSMARRARSRRDDAPARVPRRATCATICFGCCSSAATTRSPSSPSWSSR